MDEEMKISQRWLSGHGPLSKRMDMFFWDFDGPVIPCMFQTLCPFRHGSITLGRRLDTKLPLHRDADPCIHEVQGLRRLLSRIGYVFLEPLHLQVGYETPR